ncbi:hypothetical protein KJ885_00010 [Patescibacteria group bacterium]|nr:hypothetical protein [Patescibacteria group bacterium]
MSEAAIVGLLLWSLAAILFISNKLDIKLNNWHSKTAAWTTRLLLVPILIPLGSAVLAIIFCMLGIIGVLLGAPIIELIYPEWINWFNF